ncbi:S41 family peptidase [Amycolatopsis saalfeldensis]|uniref:Peptidase family S41 n=1 Tax=Amycolatopsis saalfeldensis TaxID=394193 RepID=A0A1H8X3Z3_9PSEU|nr:S41 family peptidase [Amycolatopsis saalfeldensis]SEP34387.1 Peptidase family S41 [Amycolatopsis saalfeldensis]
MRRLLAVFVVLVAGLAASAPSPASPREYLVYALNLLRAHSIDRDSLDWPEVEADALHLAANASGPAGTYPAIQSVIHQLGNPHTSLLTPAQAVPPLPQTIEVPTSWTSGDVAVLTIPQFTFDPAAERRYVDAGQTAVANADSSRPCGWIVDLRGNVGGAMAPMLTVLAPLLDEGVLGSFQGPDGTSAWTLRDGQVLLDGKPQAAEANPVRLARPRPPVAVLTDGRTASSGELTLVAFRGRSRTAAFGQATAGFVTGNEAFRLSDGAELLVTTSRAVDRAGRVYDNTPIRPDHPLPAATTNDEVVAAATAWLHTQTGCAHR